MATIKTPATSANVGPGFDCFGLALRIYNTFEVELSDETKLDNVEERFNNEDNLFLKAYRKGCDKIGISDHIHASFHCDIPVSRGLGSSASMIVGGLLAASVLHNGALDEDTIFQLASEMEGHPDNAAPCLYGSMTASLKHEDRFITAKLQLDPSWIYTVFIPDFEVSTEKARGILPSSYPREAAAGNAAHACLMNEALRKGDLDLLRIASVDMIHEPYRKQLIDEFDALKSIIEPYGVFLISGSGSTCISITQEALTPEALQNVSQLKHHWKVIQAGIAEKGSEVIP